MSLLAAAAAAAGLGSAAANIIGGVISSNKSAKAAKKNTAAQINWEMQKAQNTMQWTAEDMKKAGINPAVAAGQPNQIGSITPQMPDTSGFAKAGAGVGEGLTSMAQLMQKQQEIDSQSDLNDAIALNKRVEAGLMPRETAVKEMNAQTERRQQQVEEQLTGKYLDRITALLPYETEAAKAAAMQQALQLAIDQANNPGDISEAKTNAMIRKITFGLTDLRELKKAASVIIGGLAWKSEKNKDRISAEKISKDRFRNHREIEYNSRGKQKGVKYYEYQDY